jgi:diaminopimelate epimerase
MTPDAIDFWKLSAAGNDFVCLDARSACLDEVLQCDRRTGELARTLCDRHFGIGADGVFFAIRPDIEGIADIGALHREADGSECELCGNGTACFTYWVSMTEVGPNRHHEQVRVLTPAGVVLGKNLDDQYVRVCVPSPEHQQTGLDLQADGERFLCDAVTVGIPHAITYVDDLKATDVARWGYALRHHRAFAPRGANANFVQVLGPGEIAVRTWEFGVEGETLACGTGAAASAIMTALRENWQDVLADAQPILVRTRGGHTLRVSFALGENGDIEDCCLETPVYQTFRGTLGAAFARRVTGCE